MRNMYLSNEEESVTLILERLKGISSRKNEFFQKTVF